MEMNCKVLKVLKG